ncbi:MAG TPA: hypothetical protein VIA82_03335 [Candidatus Limnocylindria bacterium]|jgi:hypothetical protein
MRIAKLAGGAGILVLASVVGGTLIGGVLAAPRTPSAAASPRISVEPGRPLAGAASEYCDVYLDAFARELGVDRGDLLPAAKAAAKAAIDAAVKGGDLDADRGAQLKDRIDAITDPGCGFLGGLGRAYVHGFGRGFVHADVLDAAADALDLDSSDLIARMSNGDSLQDISADQDVDYGKVKADVLAAVDADLKAAVDKGLDQARADGVHDRIAAWLDAGGEPPMHRLRERRGPQGGTFRFN